MLLLKLGLFWDLQANCDERYRKTLDNTINNNYINKNILKKSVVDCEKYRFFFQK